MIIRADRVRAKRNEMGLSQTELAKLARTSQQTIANIENGKVASSRVSLGLAMALGVSVNWLHGLDDDHPDNELIYEPDESEDPLFAQSNAEYLPQYAPESKGGIPEIDVRAGAGEGAVGSVLVLSGDGAGSAHDVVGEWVFPTAFMQHELKAKRSQAFVLEVQGDSMRPTLEPGDRIIVDRSQAHFGADGAVYVISLNGDGFPQVKRVERAWEADTPMFRIISDNPANGKSVVPAARVRFIGRVVGRFTRLWSVENKHATASGFRTFVPTHFFVDGPQGNL